MEEISAKTQMAKIRSFEKGLIVGTDPVATDHQVRLIIENERKKRNLPIVPSTQIDHAIKLGLGAPIDEMKVIPVERTKKG